MLTGFLGGLRCLAGRYYLPGLPEKGSTRETSHNLSELSYGVQCEAGTHTYYSGFWGLLRCCGECIILGFMQE